jgi:hypothetical protein
VDGPRPLLRRSSRLDRGAIPFELRGKTLDLDVALIELSAFFVGVLSPVPRCLFVAGDGRLMPLGCFEVSELAVGRAGRGTQRIGVVA